MRLQSVLSAFFLTVFALTTHAGTIEIGQWIPWTVLQQEASHWPLSVQASAQNFTLQFQDWKPQAVQTDIQIAGRFQNLQINPSGIAASAQGVSAALKIGELKINQTIIREVGGNRIEIKLQAVCQPFEIRVPQFDIAASASFQKQSLLWGPVLQNLQVTVHDGWSVRNIVCQGPLGLEQRITDMLRDALKNPDSLVSLLKNYLGGELQERWSQAWAQLTAEKYQQLRISGMSEPMQDGFFLKGEITAGAGSWHVALPSQLTVMNQALTPQLVISTEGFATLVRENFGQYAIKKYDLQQIEAFRKVMKNRFIQLFAWPDLLHFGRSTPFWLSTLPDQKISLQSLRSGQWQVQLQTLGVIEVERKGQLRKYINWGLGLASKMSTQVVNSRLTLKALETQTSLNWAFDPQYVADFNPSSRISSSALKSTADALFKGKSVDVQLPVLQLQGREWKLQNWVEDRGLIWLEWR